MNILFKTRRFVPAVLKRTIYIHFNQRSIAYIVTLCECVGPSDRVTDSPWPTEMVALSSRCFFCHCANCLCFSTVPFGQVESGSALAWNYSMVCLHSSLTHSLFSHSPSTGARTAGFSGFCSRISILRPSWSFGWGDSWRGFYFFCFLRDPGLWSAAQGLIPLTWRSFSSGSCCRCLWMNSDVMAIGCKFVWNVWKDWFFEGLHSYNIEVVSC